MPTTDHALGSKAATPSAALGLKPRGSLGSRCAVQRSSVSAIPHRSRGIGGGSSAAPRSRSSVQVSAFTDTTSAPTDASVIHQRTFQLTNDAALTVVVTGGTDGAQYVRVSTDLPSRLLLHWGVEGGKNQKSGWRLPSEASRPSGTVEYKKRALQTPFVAGQEGLQEVCLKLTGKDIADYFDFVIKDTTSGQWYDLNGSNFQAPLRPGLKSESGNSNGTSNGSTGGSAATASAPQQQQQEPKQAKQLIPLDQIPPIPQDLAGVWSYMKWEADGCPNRSKEEADFEYEASLQELAMLLRQGATLETLRSVSGEGVGRYVEFIAEQKRTWDVMAPAKDTSAPREERKKEKKGQDDGPQLPQELVNLKAYLMWEAAGSPDGADFGDQAREVIAALVSAGKSYEEIEKEVRSSPPPPPKKAPAAPAAAAAAPQAAPPPMPQEVIVGEGIGMRERNPLDLVNRPSAPRLAEAPSTQEAPLNPLQQAASEDDACVWYRTYALGSKAQLLVAVRLEDPSDVNSPVTVTLTSDAADAMVLHWGVKVAGRGGDWKKPSEKLLPQGSVLLDDGIAAETPFTGCAEEECHVEIGGAVVPLQRTGVKLPRGHGLTALTFVIRSEDGSRWWNDGGSNFKIPVPGPIAAKAADPASTFDDDLSRIIVDCEVNTGAWTLMHRFNKAAELIHGVTTGQYAPADEAMAKIFVWLRYSSIRQLTWQRNYNTQPRILGAAQERLTHAIADAFDRLEGPAQEWARLCLTTVGRGGNAQAVRDEILNIMHRNKISEVKGTWMEEFHQKLHNNTTPDDVPICEAYIAFLRADGDQGAYWRVLSDAGISRARLESFDRPIKTDPVFFAEKKDNLIRDFSHYLGILKATHSGADLQASAGGAAPFVPGAAKGYLGYVLSHSNDPAVLPLVEAAVEARTELAPVLTSNRELIYLDLALENVVRSAAERGAAAAGTAAATLVAPLLQNLALTLGDNEEVCYCLKAWQELPDSVRCGRQPAKDEALRAMAVLDRVRRALAEVSDRVGAAVGGVATNYGEAFGCEPWAVSLFSEEVVRGGPAFAVSLVISSIEPPLRAAAELGAWQVISPAAVVGRLQVVPDLHGIQDKVYDEPTVLLALRVTGEEEVPVGVVGLLSGDAPDVLSHLSVRARNMKVLFAACYDAAALDEVARCEGALVQVATTAAGAVNWSEADSSSATSSSDSSNGISNHKIKMTVPKWSGKWAVGMDAFKDGVVGAKSKNLAGLRGRLPPAIALPPSVTLPFGSFEEVLARRENAEIRTALEAEIKAVTPSTASVRLAACRQLAGRVAIPEEVQTALRAGMTAAGIPTPAAGTPAWEAALSSLRAVWASKYNERAYVSTRKVGIPFDDVRMAVLVQSVVPARYAFVIHTTNPTTGDDGEIYCELVRGLGEAIVSGTVPGAALTFVARKDALDSPKVLLYPSKSEGMFVEDGSLIFRSDSNGEDLEGYAGAGLYDSVPTAPTVRNVVDYSSDPIVCDPEFARELMARVCRVGADIEAALGGAQDVEGVVDHELNITVVQTRPQM